MNDTKVHILNVLQASKFQNSMECIVITGVTGQDGSHMVDYLLENTDKYVIFGGVRRSSTYNHQNIQHITSERFCLINFDLSDSHTISKIFELLKPSYFLNFAAQSFVGCSWNYPEQTWNTNATSVIHILEGIRTHCPTCKFYQAGSSEEFGKLEYSPQNEKHPLNPQNPYGASKVASRVIVNVWRKTYNLFAIQGWLFNHEGTRRGEDFVTRKLSKGIAYIKFCLEKELGVVPLSVGNIYAVRDWSDAEDFVDGIWKMLNMDEPKDYVLASGVSTSVKDFINIALDTVDIHGIWENTTDNPLNEIYYIMKGSEKIILINIDKIYYRDVHTELQYRGDSSRARQELNWIPRSNIRDLVAKMVRYDYQIINC